MYKNAFLQILTNSLSYPHENEIELCLNLYHIESQVIKSKHFLRILHAFIGGHSDQCSQPWSTRQEQASGKLVSVSIVTSRGLPVSRTPPMEPWPSLTVMRFPGLTQLLRKKEKHASSFRQVPEQSPNSLPKKWHFASVTNTPLWLPSGSEQLRNVGADLGPDTTAAQPRWLLLVRVQWCRTGQAPFFMNIGARLRPICLKPMVRKAIWAAHEAERRQSSLWPRFTSSPTRYWICWGGPEAAPMMRGDPVRCKGRSMRWTPSWSKTRALGFFESTEESESTKKEIRELARNNRLQPTAVL